MSNAWEFVNAIWVETFGTEVLEVSVIRAIENEIGADAVRNLLVKMKSLKDIISIRGVKRKS